MASEPLGNRLDEDGAGSLQHLPIGGLEPGVAIEKVHPLQGVRLNPIGLGKMFRDRLDADGPIDMGAHPPLIIFNDIDAW